MSGRSMLRPYRIHIAIGSDMNGPPVTRSYPARRARFIRIPEGAEARGSRGELLERRVEPDEVQLVDFAEIGAISQDDGFDRVKPCPKGPP